MSQILPIKRSSFLSIIARLGIVSLLLAGIMGIVLVTPALADGGPGGVGDTDGASSLELWLEADAGVYKDAGCSEYAQHNDAVICWADQSGNGNSASSGSPPAYTTNVLNSQPVLSFNGTGDYLDTGDIDDFDYVSTYTWFAVFQVNEASSTQHVLRSSYAGGVGGAVSDRVWGTYVAGGDFYSHARSADGSLITSTHSADTSFSILAAVWGFDSVTQYLNGSAGSTAMGADAEPTNHEFTRIGASSAGDLESMDGDIAEIIAYRSTLNTPQRTLVENYLSAKYDVAIANDKYAGDTQANGDYDLDVAGIGYEPDTSHTVAHSAGLVVADTSFLNDNGDYLLFGHNVLNNSEVTGDVPPSAGLRWERVWYFDVTGANTGDSVQIAFDFSEGGMSGTPGVGTYHLLKRDGTSGEFVSVATTQKISGDQVVFEDVDVSLLGSYFTLGTGAGPGGVGETDGNSALKLWLKAGAGVYEDTGCNTLSGNGDPVACWADQSGHSNDVSASSHQPAYRTDVVNGEPVVRFNQDYLTAADRATWSFFHDGSDHTAFAVWQTATSDPGKVEYYLMGTGHQSGEVGFTFGYNNNKGDDEIRHRILKGEAGDPFLNNVSPEDAFPAGTFGIAAFRFDDGATDGDGIVYVNGAPVASADASGTPTSTLATYPLGIGSNGSDNFPLVGDMAEVIVYTSTLAPVKRTHVDLYLMDKYDIDLSGTGLYDSSVYNLNVRGISKSANVTESGSSAGLSITDVDFLTDTDDVLVFGHNAASNTGVLDDIPVGFGSRWSRVWYMVKNDVNSNGGTVRLTFDFSETGITDMPVSGGTYHLLKRDGTSGDFASILTTTTISGDQVIFDNVDVALLGSYFTLGRPPIPVDTTDDELNSDGDCSLREAIQAANHDTTVDGCHASSGADTIILSAGDYILTLANVSGGENENTTGDLDITDVLIIVGAGSGQTTIDANTLLDRVFDIRPGVGTMIFSGTTIINGSVTGNGGGIYNDAADLTLINTIISSNSASGDGGGVYVAYGSMALSSGGQILSNSASYGGGIYVQSGSATMSGGEICSNVAGINGGGVYVESGSATLSGGQILSNTAIGDGGGVYVNQSSASFAQTNAGSGIAYNSASNGGGLYAGSGSATVSGGEIHSNSANYDGGGVYVSAGSATLSGGEILSNSASRNGGGVYVSTGSATLSGGEIHSNSASSDGGGVYVSAGSATLSGGQIRSNSAGGDGGGVYVSQIGGTFVQNEHAGSSGIAYNSASDSGGGMHVYLGTVTLSGGQVVDNTAANDGGGIYNNAGTVTINNATVARNVATLSDGGGIYNGSAMALTDALVFDNASGSGASDGDGGGICNTGTMALDGVQIYDNTATRYGGGIFNGDGGALTLVNSAISTNTTDDRGGGLYLFNSDATLSANTISDNNADHGGGLYLLDSDNVTLSGNTISGNTASLDGGGLYLSNSDATLSANTISDNYANKDGGGFYLNGSDAVLINNIIADNQAGDEGSALYSYGSCLPRLVHNTIVRNTGSTGVHVNGSTVALTNTILVSHTTGISVESGDATLDATLWHGNTTNWSGTTIARSNDRFGPPAFEDPANGDYHLIPWLSAATDTGVDAGITVDFDGNVRPQGAGFDIGAFEGPETGLALVKTVTPPSAAPGQIITYTLVYTNYGPEVAYGVLITDEIPSSIISPSYASTGATITPTGSISYTWQVEDLSPGEWGKIVITGEIATGLPAGHVFTNTATITTTTPRESIPENNTGEAVVTVNLIVSTTDDELNSDGDCSLREAIQAANTDTAVDYCAAGDGDDTITLPAGTYTLVITGTGENFNATGDLDITDTLTIVGAAPDQTVIDASGGISDRVFDIRPGAGTVVISGVTIINGNVTGHGGGVYNADADLTLINTNVSANSASGSGGGVYVNAGSVTLSGGEIFNNSAIDGGGVYVFSGGVILSGGQILNNTTSGDGSGIYNASGAITHTALTITGDVYQADGTFNGGSAPLVLQGSLSIAGGTFTAPSGELGISGNFAHTGGDFTHNDGTVTFDGDEAQSLSGSNTFYNLTVNNSSGSDKVDASGSTLAVDNLLHVQDGVFVSGSDYDDVQIDSGATLELGGDITVSGDWTNNGMLVHNNHTVTLDGGDQSIAGNTIFYNLTKNVTSAVTLTFTAETTQAIVNVLDLQGVDGNLLSLRSTASPSLWNVDPQSSRTIAYLNVQDSHNVNAATIAAHAANSVDAGNNPGWNFHFPVANGAELTTDEHTPLHDTLSASDQDTGDTLTYGILTNPVNGSVAIADTATGGFVYTPTNQTESYADSFTFIVTDTGSLTDVATVTIAVSAGNDAPDAVDDSTMVLKGGTVVTLTGGYTTVLHNDSDPDGDNLTVDTTPVSGPSHGSLTLNADGTFIYTHDGSDNHSDSFTYIVSDGVLTDIATVTLMIAGVLDHVVVNPASVTLVLEETQAFTATCYDHYDNVVSGLTFTWDVVNGGGSIDSSGMFTAGTAAGTYPDTVRATTEAVSGYASVTIMAAEVDEYFVFLPLAVRNN